MQPYWAPAHMISHLRDWIFVTGSKLGLRLCLSVPKIEQGGGGKVREKYVEDNKNTPFIALSRIDNKRRISPRANKNRHFFGPIPYDYTLALLDFCNWGTLHSKLFHILRNVCKEEPHSTTPPYILFYKFLSTKPDRIFCVFSVFRLVKYRIFDVFNVYGFDDSSSISVVVVKMFGTQVQARSSLI